MNQGVVHIENWMQIWVLNTWLDPRPDTLICDWFHILVDFRYISLISHQARFWGTWYHINLIISVDTGVDIAYIVDIADIDVDIDDIDIKNPLANTDVDTDILNCDF